MVFPVWSALPKYRIPYWTWLNSNLAVDNLEQRLQGFNQAVNGKLAGKLAHVYQPHHQRSFASSV
jgi:hypothetical protein